MRTVAFALCLALASGCAGSVNTKVISFYAKKGKPRKYKRIIIFVPLRDITMSKYAEEKIQQYLAHFKVRGSSRLSIFPPIKDYTGKEMLGKARKSDYDALLLLRLDSHKQSKTTRPAGYATTHGKFVSHTYPVGGGTTITDFIRFNIDLIDVKSGNRVWVAQTNTVAGNSCDFQCSIRSFGHKIANKLADDKLIPGGERISTCGFSVCY